MKNKLLSGTGLLIIVVLILAVNLLAGVMFSRVKVDLTQEKLFTLSSGSKKIVKALPDEIRAELYCSRTGMANIPQLKMYADRVTEMLREYEGASGGKIRLEVLEPRPDTEIEEAADSNGLQGVSVDGSGERIYLGLLLKAEDGTQEKIPFLDPRREDTLEYDVTKAIYRVSHPEKKKIGVLSSIDIMGSPSNPYMMMQQQQSSKPWTFIREMKNNFQVTTVEPAATEIPKDLDLLLLVHPKGISPATQYAIDQYLLNGGKLAVFVDPFSHADKSKSGSNNMQNAMQMSYSSNLPELFKAWGIEMQKSSPDSNNPMMGMGGDSQSFGIVADPALAAKVSSQNGMAEDMIIWLSILEKNRSASEVVTSQLKEILLPAPGALKKVAPLDGLTYTPLMFTNDKAALTADMMLKFAPPNPEMLMREYKPGSAKLDLAYKISGKFKTAFPGGKPAPLPDPQNPEAAKDQPAVTKDPNQIKESKQPSTVIVVADVDMLSDDFSVQTMPFFGQEVVSLRNDNLNFVYNVVENLTNSQDLIGLRSRGRSQRPFTRIVELETKAKNRYHEEESKLDTELKNAESRLAELQQGDEKERRVLDAALMQEREQFQKKVSETRKELSKVRRHLREDVEKLQSVIMVINIALVPLAVALFGTFIAFRKTNSRRKEA